MTALMDSLFSLTLSSSLSLVAKATVTLMLALLGVRLARHSRAAVRHLWLTSGFVVLLALPVAAALMPDVRVEVAPVSSAIAKYLVEPIAIEAAPAASVSSSRQTMVPPVPRSTPTLMEMLVAVWFVGFLACALPVAVGVVQVRRFRRRGLPWPDGQRVVSALASEAGLRRPVDVALHESIGAPATCGIRRHVVLFPIDAPTWSDEDLVRAVVHELEHVRRADCLVNAFARVMCAVYWFHPLAWIAWRRLSLEAERACDDAVLRRAEATTYADQLVTLAGRLPANTRHPLLAMANRNDLVQRVAAVLDDSQSRGHAGRGDVVTAAVVAALMVAGMAPLRAVAGQQSTTPEQASPGSRPRFEVASIRRNTAAFGVLGGDCRGRDSEERRGGIAGMAAAAGATPASPGRCRFHRSTLKELIAYAYDVPMSDANRIITGAPGWAEGDRFDVEAKSQTVVTVADMKLMLQSMLEERFELRIRRALRAMQGYALIVAPSGPKVQQAAGTEARQGLSGGFAGGELTASRTPMSTLARVLSMRLGRPVEDRTRLAGTFNFTLSWTPSDEEAVPFGGRLPPEVTEKLQRNVKRSDVSLFTALQEQLGLRLIPERVDGELLVVETAARPTEN